MNVECISSLDLGVGEKSQDDEVSSSSNIQEEIKPCCPCEASLSMEAISEEEAETDRERHGVGISMRRDKDTTVQTDKETARRRLRETELQ